MKVSLGLETRVALSQGPAVAGHPRFARRIRAGWLPSVLVLLLFSASLGMAWASPDPPAGSSTPHTGSPTPGASPGPPANPWAGSPGKREFPEASAIILKDEIEATVNENGTGQLVEYDAIKILDQNGLDRFGKTYRLYDSRMESCEVTMARVWHPDGRRVDLSPGQITDSVPEALARHPIYGRMREVSVTYPGIVEGSVVEFRIVHRRKQAWPGRPFWETSYTQDFEPILDTSFTFSSPQKTPADIASPGTPDLRPTQVLHEAGRVIMRWKLQNRPMIARQPAMPPLRQLASQIQVSSFSQWEPFAVWARGMYDQAAAADAAITLKATTLTARSGDVPRRIQAILSWLGREKAPLSVELGLEDTAPATALEALNAPSLSSQDRALLLLSLLRALQIKAFPALVATADHGDPERGLPSLPQFNRLVVVVAERDGSRLWIDPLAQAPQVLGEGLQGRPALVLDGSPAHMTTTPTMPVEANREEIQGVSRLDSDGSMETVLKIREFGASAVAWRNRLQATPDRDQKDRFMELVQRINPTSVLVNHYVAPGDPRGPFSMTLTFEATSATRRTPNGDGVRLPMPLLPQRALSSYAEVPVGKRLYPVRLGSALYEERRVEVVIPQGWTVKSMPPGIQRSNEVGSFQLDVRSSGRSIWYFSRVVIRRSSIPVALYPQFKELMDLVKESWREDVILVAPAVKPNAPTVPKGTGRP